ncbi:hypothetical protein [Kribbella jiaozuonensis]|uniref:Uncharacterized protein n=1 Tax=Kribbella jiaozuonensis TaxID=2575441 RepID=A0A4U3LQY8_9ACTN|nr:hypothetical protein [Kribbella jiaozuonensis]TKK77789.1 hypothetical protein FDA38_21925 [Kribbella jiaozuonensis]
MTICSLDELLAASGETARVLADADQSAWNGRVVESTGAILGLAHWDGTLYLDDETILDPLRQMYEHAGEKQPPATLIQYRESLATLLHEQAHFLGPSGSTQEAAREAFTKPGSRELEEGVTEAWAQDHLDDYIHRLDVDKVAPGIESVEAGGYYAAFVPAVRKLTSDLESRNNLRDGEVLDLLNRHTAADQLPLLVTLVYNSTRLPDLEPTGADTRSRLESILRTGLNHLDAYELTAPGFAAAKSLSTANELLDRLHQEVQSAESAYTFSPIQPDITPTHATASPHPVPSPHAPASPHAIGPAHAIAPPDAIASPHAAAPPHANACTLPAPVPTPHAPSPHAPSPHAAAPHGAVPHVPAPDVASAHVPPSRTGPSAHHAALSGLMPAATITSPTENRSSTARTNQPAGSRGVLTRTA